MTPHNLAIVFGPTLMWSGTPCEEGLSTTVVLQGKLVEHLITDRHQLFNVVATRLWTHASQTELLSVISVNCVQLYRDISSNKHSEFHSPRFFSTTTFNLDNARCPQMDDILFW